MRELMMISSPSILGFIAGVFIVVLLNTNKEPLSETQQINMKACMEVTDMHDRMVFGYYRDVKEVYKECELQMEEATNEN